MSYKALVRNNVRKAFTLIGDLGTNVTFKRFTKNEFDFSTGETTQTTIEEIQKVLIVDTKNKERNALEKFIYVNTEFFPDLKFSESVMINNIEWKIGKVIEHNEYLTQFHIFRS